SFIRAGVLPLALAALFTGYAVEFAQYLGRQFGWRIEQPVLRVVFGSVPDWWDVLAYTVGFVVVLALAGGLAQRERRAALQNARMQASLRARR
ncbi:MAG: DUF2809 domain-containing protein, partial [Achromobacter mucicolens]